MFVWNAFLPTEALFAFGSENSGEHHEEAA